MAISEVLYTGNGSQVLFTLPFSYLEQTDVKVTVNGTPTTAFTFAFANTIQFNVAPANGAQIRIYRQTDDTQSAATFFPGSSIRASDLNANSTQLLYIAQEVVRESSNANTTAASAVTTANAAVSTANTAQANSLTAINTANTANSNSLAAVSTANTANSNASAAVSTANAASTAANNAVNTANLASADATTALNTANSTASQLTTFQGTVYTKTQLDGGQLDNRYFTETELTNGALDGRYYTEAEADARFYNVNTESIKSTDPWTNSDGFVATTAAIEARVITLVDEVGGFVPIATHTAFPTSNPDINNNAGTVVSIANISGLTHSAGTSTNATTTSAAPVTITGIPASLPSPATATGMLVVTTGTLNTYTFHRLTPEVNDVVNVANNATNITTVAGQISPTNNVATVAGISGNVTTVAGISSSVTTVAGISGNVTAVAGNSANITTVASNASSVNTVAGNTTNVNTVAGSIGNINTTAGSIANVNAVGGSIANVNTTATNIASVNTTATNVASINTVASNISNVNAVGGSIGNVNNVSNNLAAIITAGGYLNAFQGLYLGALASDPSLDSLGNPINVGDFYYNTVAEQTRIYNGVAWVSIVDNSFVLTEPPNATFSALYTAPAGTNVINLGTLDSVGAFTDETTPDTRVALANGAGTYNLGNL